MKNNVARKIALSGMLIVLNILFTSIPRYFEIGSIFSFNRITLGPAITIFSSLALGPLFGGIVGGVSDLLAWLIFPNSGAPINIFITIVYIGLGIAPYFLYKLAKYGEHVSDFLIPVLYALLIISTTCLLFFTNLFDNSFVAWGWDLLTSKIIILVLCAAFMAASLLFIFKVFKKFGDDAKKVAVTCFACEFVFMILCKPLAFLIYSETIMGLPLQEYFHVDYYFLVILSVLFACIDIPLNTFFVTYFDRIYKKLKRNN